MAQPTRQQQRARTAARTNRSRGQQKSATFKPRPFSMPFETKNIIYIAIGVGVIALGYILMGTGDALGFMQLNISPFVLVLGYLVIIPLGIMYGTRRKKAAASTSDNTSSTTV